jgi:hypothetical protein
MSVHAMPAKLGRSLRRLLAVCGLGVLCLPAVTSAAVFQTTLDQLIDDPRTPGVDESLTRGITIGDKRYSGFVHNSTGSAPVAPEDVTVRVTNLESDPQRYTLQFTFAEDAFPGERTDLVIAYDLDVLSSDFINRVGLRFNGSVPAQGTNPNTSASVIETVRTRDGSDIQPGLPITDTLVLDVFNDGPGNLEDSNSEFQMVNLTRRLHFEKDIIVSSRPDGGYAAISIVDNVVDQVPEPTAFAIVSLVGGAMLLRRRRP